jgi:3-oxoacyl-[acyl-carrier protein] reductase
MAAGSPAIAVRSFDEIAVGATADLAVTITEQHVARFADLTGDVNPLHVDPAFARTTHFQKPVVHGMLVASYVSTLVGMRIPGPGALWTRQDFRWLSPVFIGDRITLTLRVKHKSAGTNTITIEVTAVNQTGTTVLEGEGSAMLLAQQKQRSDVALAERVAFISGSASGIGEAVARQLGQAGARVVVNYRSRGAQAADICHWIESRGGKAIAIKADVTDPNEIGRAVEQAGGHFGRPVDILVNNAAPPLEPAAFGDLKWEQIQAALDVHVRGAFALCQAVLPGMTAAKSGRIVSIGTSALHGAPPAQWTPFLMAKSALLAMTRSLAVEYGPQGVQANMVSPGMTETEFIARIPERIRKVQAMQTPLRRLATADDVAQVVLFLCTPAAGHITGADLPVSGGLGM